MPCINEIHGCLIIIVQSLKDKYCNVKLIEKKHWRLNFHPELLGKSSRGLWKNIHPSHVDLCTWWRDCLGVFTVTRPNVSTPPQRPTVNYFPHLPNNKKRGNTKPNKNWWSDIKGTKLISLQGQSVIAAFCCFLFFYFFCFVLFCFCFCFFLSLFIGWMDELGFYVPSTVFQSFRDDGRVNMKGSVQWSAV